MILLDAYPLVAYLRDEAPVSEMVTPLLERAAVTSINRAEVVDRLIRQAGADPHGAIADVRALPLDSIAVGARLAQVAALLRAKHYHRVRCPVSLADCVAAAAALTFRVDALATADRHLLGIVHAEGGAVHPLPDSNGRTWSPPM